MTAVDGRARAGTDRRPRILIIVQNLPVPFDRRVWLECRTLVGAGYDVVVVCPAGPGDPPHDVIDGVEIYKYRAYTSNGSPWGFFAEFAYSFLATLWLSWRAARRGHFLAVQACNPPDIFWPIAKLFQLVHGSRFVFDHHDLSPETYEIRYPTGRRDLHRALVWLERMTVREADHVIATNVSYRDRDIARHGLPPERVTVVRTGPDPTKLAPTAPDASVRGRFRTLGVYIGVMGPQDGVDLVIEVANIVVNERGRKDIGFVLIGSGECLASLHQLRDSYGLGEYIRFTGRIPDDEVLRIMSSADIGISPDPKNGLNELCTMNKTMEYMAFGLPVAAFDLRETRVSAGSAGLYAEPNDVEELAAVVVRLADHPELGASMGAAGRARVEDELAWTHQAPRYLRVYDDLAAAAAGRPTPVRLRPLPGGSPVAPAPASASVGVDAPPAHSARPR